MRTKNPENFTFKRPIWFRIFDKSFQIYPTWSLIIRESYKTLIIRLHVSYSLFHMKIPANVEKIFTSRLWPLLFTLVFFSYTYTHFFCSKIKSCCDYCFPQQGRPQTTVQLYILWDYSRYVGFQSLLFCSEWNKVCGNYVWSLKWANSQGN